MQRGALDAVRVRAGLMVGVASSDQVFAMQEELPDADVGRFRQQAWLVAMQAGADWPFGFGAALMLPGGRVATTSDTGGIADSGLGDAELRLRQDVTALVGLRDGWARLNLTLGAVAPTGAYVSRKELVASAGGLGQTMSLGRGSWWAIGEAELTGRVGNRMGLLGAVYGRTAMGQASDGFGWANEVRAAVGLTVQVVPGVLAAAANIEHQWRGTSSEVDFLNERVPAVNTGGRWLDVVPMLRVQTAEWLALTASARVPLWRQVEGVQAVQRLTVIVGLQGVFKANPPQQVAKPPVQDQWTVRPLLVPGKLTVVDFWASWCSARIQQDRNLDTLAAARPDLAVVRVDVGDWSAAQIEARLGGAGSLPVVEVYDAGGRLLGRLVGDEAFGVADIVPAKP